MKNFAKLSLALIFAFGVMVSSMQSAEAGKRGRIIAGGILGAIALGVLADQASREDEDYDADRCYKGEEVCRRKQVCWENSHGEERCKWKTQCHRPTICE